MEYKTKEDVFERSNVVLNKTLRDIIPEKEIPDIEKKILSYANKRKGYLGDLVEWYVFGKKPDGRSEADFSIAGVELKTAPLKNSSKNIYSAKERLVFSMIDYKAIASETWENSSFLKKNKYLLILFYLYIKEASLLDYEFKYSKFLDLLNDLSEEDILQIKNDWEFIVNKIRNGQAHLLSEGDTFYLGACTKAKDSSIVREQSGIDIPAKPRAFSLKTTYLNYLIQKNLLNKDILPLVRDKKILSVEENIRSKLKLYLGKPDVELASSFGIKIGKNDKSWRRRVIVKILTGDNAKGVLELEKANITLKVVNLESNGKLKEHVSFPAFNFIKLINEDWYLDLGDTVRVSDLYGQLDEKKFMFAVFKKDGKASVFKGVFFWNFPQDKMEEAERVWSETRRVLDSGKIIKEEKIGKNGSITTFNNFPGLSFNNYLHVRPHGSNKMDTFPLPIKDIKTGRTEFTKQCFWLNAKYIAQVIAENLPNINKK